jgi:hypothetical protein
MPASFMRHSRAVRGLFVKPFASCGVLLISLLAAPAWADTVSLTVEDTLPSYRVQGNGQHYTAVVGNIGDVDFHLNAHGGTAGRIKRWSASGGAKAFDPQNNVKLMDLHDDPGRGFSYPALFRPKSIDADWTYLPTAEELVAACNKLADRMRANGQSNTSIFDRDNLVRISVSYTASVDFTSSLFDLPPRVQGADVTLTCRKWAGASVPQGAGSLQLQQGVSAATLALQEVSGLAGACKVNLSGKISTNVAGLTVRYRYEHNDGKQSSVHTVKTGSNKQVSFSHAYDIPNESGLENGSIRIVGVSHSFASDWQVYAMDCHDPATQSFQAVMKPTVAMTAQPVNNIMVGGQACPSRLKLIGTIQGQGSMFSGKAGFIGTAYLSPLEAYQISGNEVKHIVVHRTLNWTSGPALAIGGPSATGATRSQTLNLGFNITNADNQLLASVPRRDFVVACHAPQIQPPGGNVLGTQPGTGTPTAPPSVTPAPILQEPSNGTGAKKSTKKRPASEKNRR